MLISHNFNVKILHSDAQSFLPILKKMKLAILDGPISEEDIIYNPTANPEDLELASLVKSFDRLGLQYEIIDPSQDGWLNKLMQCNPIVINIHGEYGEDGRLQGLLDILNKSYIGSGLENSALSISKPLLKIVAQGLGINTPNFYKEEWADSLFTTPIEELQLPVMAKISNGGCSIGMHKIDSTADLDVFMKEKLNKRNRYFFEEYIDGRFLTVGILETEHGIFAFPPLEVITKYGFYDEEAKKDHDEAGLAEYVFPQDEIGKDGGVLQKIAHDVFLKTGANGFARVDFMVDKNNQPQLLELNTIAGLSSTGNFASSAKQIGLSYDNLIINILKIAMQKTPYRNITSSEHTFGTPLKLSDI